jgi:outer membrane protein TolC
LLNYEQTVLNALEEAETALVDLANSREREAALANATDAARNATFLARQRYSAGLIDFQSVLDTERSLLVVEELLAGTRANGVSALIRLYKALGGGWSPEADIQTAGKDVS